MSAGKRNTLRVIVLIGWLVLALMMVESALAQGDQSNQTGDELQSTVPKDLDQTAVRLLPLLAGAALIERTMEFLFTWVERAVLDVSNSLHELSIRLTGLVQIDVRQAWNELDELTNAMLHRQQSKIPPAEGNPGSPNPSDWPLSILELRLVDAQKKLEQAQGVIKDAMKSPLYTSRKKMAANWMSIFFGIGLAVTSSLRLFEPMGVQVADSIQGGFDVFDMILAGILMGLGTDWVHQVIGVIIQGKGLLGRAAGGQPSTAIDTEQISQLITLTMEQEFRRRLDELGDSLRREAEERINPDDETPH
jgi:hypothetical protein